MEILLNKPYIATVECIEQSRFLKITKETYLYWLKNDPDFSLFVNKELCTRLSNFATKAMTTLCFPLEYSVLLIIDYKYNEDLDSDLLERGSVGISKEYIAQSLGTSIRTINRIFKKLIEVKIIKKEESGFNIINIEKLKNELMKYE